MGHPRPDWLLVKLHWSVVMLHWISAVSWPMIGQAISVHLRPNHWLDWAQIWWTNSLWASPGLINFWSCSTEFWSCSTEFPLFPDLWLVEQFPCIWRQAIDQIGLKGGGPTHYRPPRAWLTFSHAALNPSSDYPPLWFNPPAGSCIRWCIDGDYQHCWRTCIDGWRYCCLALSHRYENPSIIIPYFLQDDEGLLRAAYALLHLYTWGSHWGASEPSCVAVSCYFSVVLPWKWWTNTTEIRRTLGAAITVSFQNLMFNFWSQSRCGRGVG